MEGRYQAYPEYKASGVEWLGEIPLGWDISNLSSLSNKITNGYVGPTREIFKESGIRYLQSLHIKQNKINFHTPYYVSSEWSNGKAKSILAKGDVLIVQTGDIGQAAAVPKQFEGCNCHALIIISTTDGLNGFYLAWVLNSDYGFHSLKSIQTGALHPHLNCDTVKTIKTPIPSPHEQTLIANFLDYETTKIDTLIEKQQQLTKLLGEKRHAVISHAVTKGLNPDTLMKDSGVEWLGEVPEHWALPKVSHISRVLNGSTPDKNNFSFWEDGTIPWLASSCLNNEVVCEPSMLISKNAYDTCSVELIPAGSLLVGMVGQGKTRGTSAVLGIDSCINQNMAAIIPCNKIKIGYFQYLFQAMYEDLRELGRGGNQAALNCEIISSLRIPLPSVHEQTLIAAWLDKTVEKLDLTTCLAQQQINILRERRTALISAAVTGKIDVRNWQASTPQNN